MRHIRSMFVTVALNSIAKLIHYPKFLSFAVAFAFATPAFACEVRLKHPAPICPAATYGPEDCLKELSGKAGDRVTHPATIHIMENGRSYYCPSREGCVEVKDLSFKGCQFTHVNRQPGELKEYTGHIVVK